ncbi:MAG: putative integral membrane protein, partial [Myxococcota bacterium]
MADPNHVPVLDGLDRFTVGLYRMGLVIASAGVLYAGIRAAFATVRDLPDLMPVILVGVMLCVANVHLYDKLFRWIFGALGITGAVMWALADWHMLIGLGGLGFVFAALSAFALKEQFCFRVPGMRLVPFMLAASLIGFGLDEPIWIAVLLLPAGILL